MHLLFRITVGAQQPSKHQFSCGHRWTWGSKIFLDISMAMCFNVATLVWQKKFRSRRQFDMKALSRVEFLYAEGGRDIGVYAREGGDFSFLPIFWGYSFGFRQEVCCREEKFL